MRKKFLERENNSRQTAGKADYNSRFQPQLEIVLGRASHPLAGGRTAENKQPIQEQPTASSQRPTATAGTTAKRSPTALIIHRWANNRPL